MNLPDFARRKLVVFGTCLSSLLGVVAPAQAAEQVVFAYGALSRTLPVRAIETYAREGKITPELSSYAGLLNSGQLEQVRSALNAVAPSEVANVVAVAQFLYTPEGEAFLARAGEVVRTGPKRSGALAIRGALIRAAADPEGITLVNFLRYFPTPRVYIDVRQGVEVAQRIQRLLQRTRQVVSQASAPSGDGAGLDFSQLPDLQKPGPFLVDRYVLEDLVDASRNNRPLPTDLYLPRWVTLAANPAADPPSPLLVISHGLGEDRTSFRYLAVHLASYGYTVAVLEHPGSSSQRIADLLAGQVTAVVDPQEFIDRPKDVSFVLDELSRRAQTDPQLRGRIRSERVGIFGHSFGGYTALALAGAELELASLQAACANRPDPSLNPSVVLQCRAASLSGDRLNLSDPRVQGVVVANPVTSLIFGRRGMAQVKVPVMVVSGTNDTVAPALSEQIEPFAALPPPKYLITLTGGTHFSTDDPGAGGVIKLPEAIIGPAPELARQYVSALSVAFFNTTVAQDPDFAVYLSSEYAQALSRAPLPLQLNLEAPPLQRSRAEADLSRP